MKLEYVRIIRLAEKIHYRAPVTVEKRNEYLKLILELLCKEARNFSWEPSGSTTSDCQLFYSRLYEVKHTQCPTTYSAIVHFSEDKDHIWYQLSLSDSTVLGDIIRIIFHFSKKNPEGILAQICLHHRYNKGHIELDRSLGSHIADIYTQARMQVKLRLNCDKIEVK